MHTCTYLWHVNSFLTHGVCRASKFKNKIEKIAKYIDKLLFEKKTESEDGSLTDAEKNHNNQIDGNNLLVQALVKIMEDKDIEDPWGNPFEEEDEDENSDDVC